MLRAAAKPQPKPKAMVPLARHSQAAAPITPGVGGQSRPGARAPAPALGRASQAPLTPGLAGSKRLSAAAPLAPMAPAMTFAHEEEEDDAQGAPLPPKRPPPIKQQVESYFSDQGLKSDRYLQDLITESPGGWVSLDDVMGLRKIKALKTTAADILHALRDSWLEISEEDDGSSAAIRRPPGRAMPKPEEPKAQAPRRPAVAQRTSAAEGVVQADMLYPSGGKAGGKARAPAQAARQEASGRPLFPGRLNGAVRSYDEETGGATIACPQTQALFQQDLPIGWRDLESAGVAINIGSLVSFRVELGPNGEPRARDLELRAPDDEEEDYEQPLPPAKRAKVAQAVVGQRYVGTIKSFHEGIGLGFIGCKATHNTFGRDVSVHKVELSGFEVGDTVSFELAAEPEVGTPKAINLEAPGSPSSAAPAPPASKPPSRNGTEVNVAAPKAGIVKKAKAAPKPAPKPEPKAAAAPASIRRWKGVIESFDKVKNVGRIRCIVNGVTRRCTVDGGELAGFAIGDSVSFRLTKDASGAPPQAHELEAEAE